MRAAIFVDRTSLSIAGGDLKSSLTIPVPSTVVQDMEVINEEELARLITEPIEKNKLKPASYIICFAASCTFQKEIPEKTLEADIKKIHEEFDENIPFNRILSKVFTQAKAAKVIGINKDLATAIIKALALKNWSVDAIVPSYALYGDQAVTFSTQVSEQLIKHYSSLQQVSFSLETDEAASADADETAFTEEHQKPKSNRMFILVGIFVFLILILIMVYMLQQRNNENKARDVTAPAPTQIAAPMSPPTETPVPTETELIPKDEIAIQVLNGSGIPGEADRVKDRLAEADFTNIQTGNAPTQESEDTSIVVKPSVPRAYREEISTMIKSLGFTVSLRENAEIEQDVLITTYQNPS